GNVACQNDFIVLIEQKYRHGFVPGSDVQKVVLYARTEYFIASEQLNRLGIILNLGLLLSPKFFYKLVGIPDRGSEHQKCKQASDPLTEVSVLEKGKTVHTIRTRI